MGALEEDCVVVLGGEGNKVACCVCVAMAGAGKGEEVRGGEDVV